MIQATPRTIRELHELLLPVGVDLVGTLRERLYGLTSNTEAMRGVDGFSLVLLVRLPKTRVAGGEVESEELRAFAFKGPLSAVAREVSSLSCDTDENRMVDASENVELVPLNPRPGLTRALAAEVNGQHPNASHVIAVGLGSLGSQVVVNLVRGGFGQWTLVDNDLLQPHNMGRHALGSWAVGWPKAIGLAEMLNTIVEGPAIAHGVVESVGRLNAPTKRSPAEWRSASTILDMSASIAVARYLCHNIQSSARRVSLFLNPSGTALTLLAEDRERSVPLDFLEMQHYRALTHDTDLAGLLSPPSTMRSGVGCRDVSTQIPQDMVSVFAGIGSRSIRRTDETDRAQIVTWKLDEPTDSIICTEIEVSGVHRRKENGWRIFFDSTLERRLRDYRNAKLPSETGGILIGSSDMGRRIIYVVDATEAPRDSQECPHGFLRGSQGLQQAVQRIQEATSGMLGYIGEWHSHPPKTTADPSIADRKVMEWVKETLDDEGQVGIVGIVGSKRRLNFILCGSTLY
ncbi:MAG: ThiF family adenylyltransferase [Chloroflexi bacterium]|nr:ThiF family adenylyltransferase [Chloroflexota bacterium]